MRKYRLQTMAGGTPAFKMRWVRHTWIRYPKRILMSVYTRPFDGGCPKIRIAYSSQEIVDMYSPEEPKVQNVCRWVILR